MSCVVGPRGQVTIDKAIREKLGVEPGWRAIQVMDGHRVVIYFVPPRHRRSLAGRLASYAQGAPAPSDEAIDRAVEKGVAEEWIQSEERIRLQLPELHAPTSDRP